MTHQSDENGVSSTAPTDVNNDIEIVSMDRDSKPFWDLEELFNGWLNNQIQCYNHERIEKKLRPLSFNLIGAATIINKRLNDQHEACKTRLLAAGRSVEQLRTYRAFHGSHPKNLTSIATHGLLRIGHPLNPSKSTDPGYFGTPTKGIYVSRKVDYCLKYSNRGEPLEPKEQAKVLMFDVIPGLSLHVKEMKLGMDPTPGYDSHSSANFNEWYLFNEDQCIPRMILTVRAFENRRTDEDDMKHDSVTNNTHTHTHPTPAPATPTPTPTPVPTAAPTNSAGVASTGVSTKTSPTPADIFIGSSASSSSSSAAAASSAANDSGTIASVAITPAGPSTTYSSTSITASTPSATTPKPIEGVVVSDQIDDPLRGLPAAKKEPKGKRGNTAATAVATKPEEPVTPVATPSTPPITPTTPSRRPIVTPPPATSPTTTTPVTAVTAVTPVTEVKHSNNFSSPFVYTAGGRFGDVAIDHLFQFITPTSITKLPATLDGSGHRKIGRIGSMVYLTGGLHSKDCYCLDVNTMIVSTMPPLAAKRVNHVMVTVDDRYLYAIGGSNIGELSSVEMFDTKTNRWSPAPSLNIARESAAAVVVNRCIYVFGGKNQSPGVAPNRAGHLLKGEVLDLSQPSPAWKLLAAAPTARVGHQCIAVGDLIYVMGGIQPKEQKSRAAAPSGSVEVFDAKAGWLKSNWSACHWQLPDARWLFAATYHIATDTLMIYGGLTVDQKALLHTYTRTVRTVTRGGWVKLPLAPVNHALFSSTS